MEIQGTVKVIGEVKEIGSKGFKKRELVVTVPDDKYPQHILVEFIQDKTNLLDGLVIGQRVTVFFNINGREWINPQWEAKYFNAIQGWRIETLQEGASANVTPAQAFEPATDLTADEPNDLPF